MTIRAAVCPSCHSEVIPIGLRRCRFCDPCGLCLGNAGVCADCGPDECSKGCLGLQRWSGFGIIRARSETQ